jgi:hypothetical protein
MIHRFATLCRRYDPRKLPSIHRAFALSIALHALTLFWGNWQLPMEARLPFEDSKKGKPFGTLAARLAPEELPSPPPGAKPVPPPAPQPQQAARKPPAAPRVLAREAATPAIPTPPPAESASPPAAASPPALEDFAASVAARQRAREAASASAPPAAPPSPPGPVETERERHNRAVAANLGLDRPATFGVERHPGGGMFQVQHVTSDQAELVFFGWNKDIRRNARQVLSVRRGNNPSIEIALVRRMIAIIREHESGDFIWESLHGRNLTLSARVADNAGLEDVLMREFFPAYAARR